MKRELRPSIELLVWPGEIVLIALAWALWDNPGQGTTVALIAIVLFQAWLIGRVFQGYGWKWGIVGILLPPVPIAFFWLDGKLPVTKRLASGVLLFALLLTLSAAAIGKGTVLRITEDLLAEPEPVMLGQTPPPLEDTALPETKTASPMASVPPSSETGSLPLHTATEA
ncbi:MAG: hypothetical protein D6812_10145, partial [Deltaproteobacteria bacterium]